MCALWAIPEKHRSGKVMITLFNGLVQPLINAKKAVRTEELPTRQFLVDRTRRLIGRLVEDGHLSKDVGLSMFRRDPLNNMWDLVTAGEYNVLTRRPQDPGNPVLSYNYWHNDMCRIAKYSELVRPWYDALYNLGEFMPGTVEYSDLTKSIRLQAVSVLERAGATVKDGEVTGFTKPNYQRYWDTASTYFRDGRCRGLDTTTYLERTMSNGNFKRADLLALMLMSLHVNNIRGAALFRWEGIDVGKTVLTRLLDGLTEPPLDDLPDVEDDLRPGDESDERREAGVSAALHERSNYNMTHYLNSTDMRHAERECVVAEVRPPWYLPYANMDYRPS